MLHRRTLVLVGLLLFVAGALATTSGCQKLRMQFQLKTTVSDPEPESPKWVVHQAIVAAMEKDEAKAWEAFSQMLHSSEKKSQQNWREWRQLRFSTFQRKVHLYLEDDNVAEWEFRYMDEQDDGAIRLFVHNAGDPELPTPCRLRKDPEQDMKWRIYNCSL